MDVTQLLDDWRNGDLKALDKLIPIVYAELRSTAERYLRKERPDHTLQPTALVHETYLRLVKTADVPWKNRKHFFAAAAQTMRHLLVNHALARKAQKRGGGCQITLNEAIGSPFNKDLDVVILDDALKKLASLDERACQIVELRFFSGLTNEEIAEVLGTSLTTVNADWRMAKAWLSLKLKKHRQK